MDTASCLTCIADRTKPPRRFQLHRTWLLPAPQTAQRAKAGPSTRQTPAPRVMDVRHPPGATTSSRGERSRARDAPNTRRRRSRSSAICALSNKELQVAGRSRVSCAPRGVASNASQRAGRNVQRRQRPRSDRGRPSCRPTLRDKFQAHSLTSSSLSSALSHVLRVLPALERRSKAALPARRDMSCRYMLAGRQMDLTVDDQPEQRLKSAAPDILHRPEQHADDIWL